MKRLASCAVLIGGILFAAPVQAEDIQIRIVNTRADDTSVFVFQKPPTHVPHSGIAWMQVPRTNNTVQVFEWSMAGPKPVCVATVASGDTVYTMPAAGTDGSPTAACVTE